MANATATSGGYPHVHPIGSANRALVFPAVYKDLLEHNALTAEENYRMLRWFYQEIQYIYKEKSQLIFINGNYTPNTTTNFYRDNFGPWHISALYNTFGFFGEFSESSQWQNMFEKRLSLLASILTNSDGSYVEVTFGYPSAVFSWYSTMLNYMGELGYKSASSETLIQTLIDISKYLMDCSYPNGSSPSYGDGGSINVRSLINNLFKIKGIENNKSIKLQNLLWYYTNGKEGIEPDKTSYYNDSKLIVDRTGWSSNDSMFFMNAKSGGDHAHVDSLAILAYTKGKNLLKNTGTITYDSSNEGFDLINRTNTHNTVEVDKQGQRLKGKTVTSGYDGTSDNLKYYSNNSATTVRAYTSANSNAMHYRNVTYLKQFDNMIIVSDSLKPTDSKSHTYTQNWHTLTDSNPVVTTNINGFTNDVWGYTNFASGANMMIAQGNTNNDANGVITAEVPYGSDESSSTQKSQYFEFTQSGKGNVSFNTAIAMYDGKTEGIIE